MCIIGDWDVAAVSVTAGTFAAEDVAAETVVAVGLYRHRFNQDFLAVIYKGQYWFHTLYFGLVATL